MFKQLAKRNYIAALLISFTILSTTGYKTSVNAVYAQKATAEQSKSENIKSSKVTNQQIQDTLSQLQQTLSSLESKVNVLEQKLDTVNTNISNLNQQKVVNKWKDFADSKPEKTTSEAVSNDSAVTETQDKTNTAPSEETKADDPAKQSNNVYKLRYNISAEKAVKDKKELGIVLVGNKQVIIYRNGFGDLSPFERAKIVAKKLETIVENKGNLNNLIPTFSNGVYTGNYDNTAIFTVDTKTAGNNPAVAKNLTTAWVNNIREAFGVKPIKKQSSTKTYYRQIAHQILKPRKNPLTTTIASRSFDRSLYIKNKETQESPIIQIIIPDNAENSKTVGSYLGQASWYGPGFNGRRTASGHRFDMNALTAAHKTLPFGTVVKVTNMRNNKSCLVKITDRGPYAHGRIIDLSKGAASEIGMLGSGVAKVKVEILSKK